MATETKSLQEQAQEILRIAEANGVEQNFFFVTTFKRYQVQINMLTDLERAMEYADADVLDTKAIDAYNKTSSAANGTAQTLMRIIQGMRPKDPLARAILERRRET